MLSEVASLAPIMGPYCFRMTKECLFDICLWPRAVKSRLLEVPPETACSPLVPGRSDCPLEVQAQSTGLPFRSSLARLQENLDLILARRWGNLRSLIRPPQHHKGMRSNMSLYGSQTTP